jgi:hypothetical protein
VIAPAGDRATTTQWLGQGPSLTTRNADAYLVERGTDCKPQ